MAACVTELFGTHPRYSGASLGYPVGAVLGGGLTPIIATALQGSTRGAIRPVGAFVSALVVVP